MRELAEDGRDHRHLLAPLLRKIGRLALAPLDRTNCAMDSPHGNQLRLADPKMKELLANLRGAPMPMTPAGFGRLMAVETDKWPR